MLVRLLGTARAGYARLPKPLSFSISSESRDGDIRLLRPADAELVRREAANKQNTLHGVTCLTINAKKHITEEKILITLHRIAKMVPSFRTCLRMHNDELWVCKLPQLEIDFKVLRGINWRKEAERLLHEGYDSYKGPMWRARLLREDGILCPVPEHQREFPHQLKLIIAFHLGIVGGPTITKINGLVNKFLNNDVPNDDDKDTGRFISEEETKEIEEILNTLREKPLADVKSELENQKSSHYTPLLLQALGQTQVDVDAQTEFEMLQVGYESSQKILKCCKSNGITVNSFMIAALNAAVMQMVKDSGIQRENYNIISRFAVDCRRYLSGDTRNVMNPFGFPLTYTNKTPRNVLESFWKYATQLHSDLKIRISQKQPLYEYAFSKDRQPKNFSHDSYYAQTYQPVDIDYYFSNVNTKSDILPGVAKSVQTTHICILQSIHRTGAANLFILNTFRDSMQITVVYSTQFMSRDATRKLLENLAHVISYATD